MKTARITLIASGTLVMAYAVSGALTDKDVKFGALLFLVGVLVFHDALFLPLTIGAGALIGWLVPAALRGTVRAAAVVSLALTVVALPLVLGRGRVPDNPSVLPLRYGAGLLISYAAIWLAAGLVEAVRRWRRRVRPGSA